MNPFDWTPPQKQFIEAWIGGEYKHKLYMDMPKQDRDEAYKYVEQLEPKTKT